MAGSVPAFRAWVNSRLVVFPAVVRSFFVLWQRELGWQCFPSPQQSSRPLWVTKTPSGSPARAHDDSPPERRRSLLTRFVPIGPAALSRQSGETKTVSGPRVRRTVAVPDRTPRMHRRSSTNAWRRFSCQPDFRAEGLAVRPPGGCRDDAGRPRAGTRPPTLGPES